MLFELATVVLAPLMWTGGYVGYRAEGPLTSVMRYWLIAVGVLAVISVSTTLWQWILHPDGDTELGLVISSSLALILEGIWFIIGTLRGPTRSGKTR